MNYRSLSQLTDQVWAWARELPGDLDLVVGVPRSGLLVANLLAVFRNLPLTDVDGLLEGRIIATGRRYKGALREGAAAEPLKVLVVDDSVWGGGTMQRVKAKLGAADLPHQISFGAVYVRPGFEGEVDFYCEALDIPRFFEWNIIHHKVLHHSCMEIDGVLCEVPDERTDVPDRDEEALVRARPLLLPTEKIGWLVTARPERYRPATEEWLSEHGVEYGELIMMSPLQQRERRDTAASAFKAEVYNRTAAKLFYEGSPERAIRLASYVDKPVFCVESMQMVGSGAVLEPRYVTPRHSGFKWILSVARLRVRKQLSKGMRAARALVGDPARWS
ncbi:phosphoribosyltransferase family protein [soil metagenome]